MHKKYARRSPDEWTASLSEFREAGCCWTAKCLVKLEARAIPQILPVKLQGAQVWHAQEVADAIGCALHTWRYHATEAAAVVPRRPWLRPHTKSEADPDDAWAVAAARIPVANMTARRLTFFHGEREILRVNGSLKTHKVMCVVETVPCMSQHMP